jgi:two-component system CheB/CheR fusion protein
VIGHQKILLNARRIVGKSSELSLILLTTKDVGDPLNVKEKNV